mmetsp:Transcript_10152/g.11652  ORF Transcript_10152/g.11652 Transcript_10152/m.11652 type:complete len:231 (-) Transcript_10152:438-1130(-)|eukprot:CAMPEP_0184009820 /NCGR_PEP_ID=MMETSP0954-20121128/2836_1 /TAXON_ID=627963 /ORGANISM="Aplanochytrium sp, Strain PBS07" /LENGTH=230 /DNA_ID=CAMNT_0026289273 /DNA_START=51 /DNA_END=743 /DNA_ORIENTATION=-
MGPTLEDKFVAAAKENDVATLTHYLSNGLADVNCHNKHNMTALYYACHSQNKDMAKFLLDEDDIDVNLRSKKNPSWTPLMTVCNNGCLDIVLLLLDHPDIEINAVNEKGWTAFMYACFKGHSEVVKRMCWRNDVDILKKNADGNDAEALARKELKWGIVEQVEEKKKKLPYETEVGKMLKKHNLDKYAPILFEHSITSFAQGSQVRTEDLEEWGIALDDAKERILYYISG